MPWNVMSMLLFDTNIILHINIMLLPFDSSHSYESKPNPKMPNTSQKTWRDKKEAKTFMK